MTDEADGSLRILLLNWQDRENPQAGGAEVHLHEIFGRLVSRGHSIRAVVSGWSGAKKNAELDGLSVRRVGGRYTYALRAPGVARKIARTWRPHVVVEDINKVPLYAPRWTATPVVALVPHLFGTTAFREVGPLVASVVWAAERGIPAAYRRCPFQVISKGTALDLVARGIPGNQVTVIPPGIDHTLFRPDKTVERSDEPTILYVGRLKRYKGIDILIQAVARLRDEGLVARLVIVGRGDDQARLKDVARLLKVSSQVRFVGYVGELEKLKWLRQATVVAYPSPKEGWGIANVEAAACGTPVVASDSPGLRESVHADVSGLLVEHTDVNAWSNALRRVLLDGELRERLSQGGVRHAEGFSWDRAAEETEAHLVEVIASLRRKYA